MLFRACTIVLSSVALGCLAASSSFGAAGGNRGMATAWRDHSFIASTTPGVSYTLTVDGRRASALYGSEQAVVSAGRPLAFVARGARLVVTVADGSRVLLRQSADSLAGVGERP